MQDSGEGLIKIFTQDLKDSKIQPGAMLSEINITLNDFLRVMDWLKVKLRRSEEEEFAELLDASGKDEIVNLGRLQQLLGLPIDYIQSFDDGYKRYMKEPQDKKRKDNQLVTSALMQLLHDNGATAQGLRLEFTIASKQPKGVTKDAFIQIIQDDLNKGAI